MGKKKVGAEKYFAKPLHKLSVPIYSLTYSAQQCSIEIFFTPTCRGGRSIQLNPDLFSECIEGKENKRTDMKTRGMSTHVCFPRFCLLSKTLTAQRGWVKRSPRLYGFEYNPYLVPCMLTIQYTTQYSVCLIPCIMRLMTCSIYHVPGAVLPYTISRHEHCPLQVCQRPILTSHARFPSSKQAWQSAACMER